MGTTRCMPTGCGDLVAGDIIPSGLVAANRESFRHAHQGQHDIAEGQLFVRDVLMYVDDNVKPTSTFRMSIYDDTVHLAVTRRGYKLIGWG